MNFQSCALSKLESRVPLCPLGAVELSVFKGRDLKSRLDSRDVQQECTDRVALGVEKVVELCHGETFDVPKDRPPRIVHHRDQSTNLWTEANDVADQEEPGFGHRIIETNMDHLAGAAGTS